MIGRRFAATLSGQKIADKELLVPELPEVENIALGLRPVLVGQRVACIGSATPSSFAVPIADGGGSSWRN